MGGLHELLWLYVKFQPGLAGNFHLRVEQQPLAFLDIHNLPEIKGVTDPEVMVVSSPA